MEQDVPDLPDAAFVLDLIYAHPEYTSLIGPTFLLWFSQFSYHAGKERQRFESKKTVLGGHEPDR